MADDLTPPGSAPVVLDRAALERVLARASELQAAIGDAPEALSESQLLELGTDVGIESEHLRQALAEERGRGLVPPEGGLGVWFAGPTVVAAARVVPGTPQSVLAALDATMQRDEVLVLKRRFPERLSWEAQRGFIGGLRRWLALSGRGQHLYGATDVSATVAAVDSTRVHVRLVASFRDARSRQLATAATACTAFLLAGAPVLAINVPAWLAAMPLLVLGGATLIATRRGYRRLLANATVALEQVLDRLEYGPAKSSGAAALLEVIAGAPRR